MHPSAQQMNAIYQRLLTGEPDAPSDFIELLLEPLIEALRAKFPKLPDPDLATDVASDTLLTFVQSPEKYQPDRGGLWQYLYMDALGDLHNAWAKEQRRQKKIIVFDPVAHDRSDGNSNVEEEVMRRLGLSSLPEGIDAQMVLNRLHSEIPDHRDWQVVLLMFSGRNPTGVYAAALNIEHLPIKEQREYVKKAQDRLRRRLKRFGVKIHEQ